MMDARAVRAWLALAVSTAESTRPLVDSLNVFPVPDADTGTNVVLTLRSATDALRLLPGGADLLQVTRALADGAVRGARGNSGLLISQALAALADVAAEAPDPSGLRPVELVHVYERISTSTWAAVSRPVAGTLLTVAADAAAAARSVLEESAAVPPSVADIAGAASLGAQESVVETAGLGHGPVDAGGAALMLMLTALSDVLSLQDRPSQEDSEGSYTRVAHQMLADLAAGGVAHGSRSAPQVSTGEFEVMYLLEATTSQAQALRRRLEDIGDCVGVVGTPDALGVGLFQVHVHTDTPRAALARTGRARQVCIHHLHPTSLTLTRSWEESEPPLPVAAPAEPGAGRVVSFERMASRRRGRADGRPADAGRPRGDQVGVIACTRAPGLIEQLARTGAVVVLDPDRDGIVRATGDLGMDRILVLPCDPASASRAHEAARFLTARSVASTVRAPARPSRPQAGALRTPQLLVADTDDEARVLAAAVAVAGRSAGESWADLALRASRAGAGMRTFALDGESAEPEAAARTVMSLLRADDELLTVILGRDALPDVGALVASAAAQRAEELTGDVDSLEVTVHAGNQSGPDVLLAIE